MNGGYRRWVPTRTATATPAATAPHASAAAAETSRDDLEAMTVKELRKTVEDWGLPTWGLSMMRKAELIDYLLAEKDDSDDDVLPEEQEEALEQVAAAADEHATTAAIATGGDEEAEHHQADAAADPEEAKQSPAIEDIESPGVETLREYLKYSDYGIRKARDQRRRGEAILAEIDDGARDMPAWYYEDFVEDDTEDVEDPTAIVVDEWGSWDERDLAGPPVAGDWDREVDPDPNALDPQFEYATTPKDEDGVEKGFDPVFGSWCEYLLCLNVAQYYAIPPHLMPRLPICLISALPPPFVILAHKYMEISNNNSQIPSTSEASSIRLNRTS